jgi:hypothetical protein
MTTRPPLGTSSCNRPRPSHSRRHILPVRLATHLHTPSGMCPLWTHHPRSTHTHILRGNVASTRHQIRSCRHRNSLPLLSRSPQDVHPRTPGSTGPHTLHKGMGEPDSANMSIPALCCMTMSTRPRPSGSHHRTPHHPRASYLHIQMLGSCPDYSHFHPSTSIHIQSGMHRCIHLSP